MARTGKQIFQESYDVSNNQNIMWGRYTQTVLGQPIVTNSPPFVITSNPYPPPELLNTNPCSDIYISVQYFNDISHLPTFNIYMYKSGTGNNIQVVTWTSAVKRKDNVWGSEYGGVYFSESTFQNPNAVGYKNKLNSSNDWWVGHGSPQSEVLIFDKFFQSATPFENLLLSGNNQALNSNSEKVAFQIQRDFDGVGVGDEYIKRQFYVKPRVNVGDVTSSYGEVRNERTISASWTFPYNSTSGDATHFLAELYDQNNVRRFSKEVAKTEGSYVEQGNLKRRFTWNICNSKDLAPDVNYYLVITPYYKYKGTNYRYTNVSKRIDNFVRFSPRPRVSPTINALSPDVRRDEKNFSISFTYNNRPVDNGVASKFAVVLSTGSSTYNVGIVNNSDANNNVGVKTYSITANITALNISTSDMYTCSVTPIYSATSSGSSLGGTPTTRSNYVRRDPRPLRAITDLKVDGVITDHVIKPSEGDLVLSWSYDDSNQATYGIANGYQLVFTGSDVPTLTYNFSNEGIRIPLSVFERGVQYTLAITPFYNTSWLGTETKTYPNFLLRDGGIASLGFVSPSSNTGTWFFGDTDVSELPKFRIAFMLPEDLNYKYMSEQEQTAYRYKELKVTYEGNGMVEKVYDVSQNSTEENPTWICVSDSGELTHKNTVIIDLTGIGINPMSYAEDEEIKYKYEITVAVKSQYDRSTSTTYTIDIVDLPFGLSDDDKFPKSEEYITASSFEGLIEARNIVATFTDYSEDTLESQKIQYEEVIKYSCFSDIVAPVNSLYVKTRDWKNVKKYATPRSISENGTITEDAPYFKANTPTDRIFDISFANTKLSVLSDLPEDYEENYNSYFQQPQGEYTYTFRSMNGNVPVVEEGEDLPIYSAPEYNVLFSYYSLYHSLATDTVLDNPIYYLIQSTMEYTSSTDTQSYGGRVNVPDIQLRSDYIYEIDAKLASGTDLPQRQWTVFGGSYDKVNNNYQGLFCSIGNADGLLHLISEEQENGYVNTATPVTISNDRTIYRFEPNVNLNYIKSTVQEYYYDDYQEYSSYIYVPIDLYSDYTYEITGNIKSYSGRFYSVLGGSTASGKTFVAVNGDTLYSKANGSNIRTLTRENGDHTYVFEGNSSHTLSADGGFFLLACRDYSTGERFLGSWQEPDSFFGRCGYINEVKIKDADGVVIMDFVSEKVNGQNGMRDLISGTFYAPHDNTKFSVSSNVRTTNGFMIFAPKDYSLEDGKILGRFKLLDSLYGRYGRLFGLNIYDSMETLLYSFIPSKRGSDFGMLETVTSTFYPCNDNDKFYLKKEGEEPNLLGGGLLGGGFLGDGRSEDDNPDSDEPEE